MGSGLTHGPGPAGPCVRLRGGRPVPAAQPLGPARVVQDVLGVLDSVTAEGLGHIPVGERFAQQVHDACRPPVPSGRCTVIGAIPGISAPAAVGLPLQRRRKVVG